MEKSVRISFEGEQTSHANANQHRNCSDLIHSVRGNQLQNTPPPRKYSGINRYRGVWYQVWLFSFRCRWFPFSSKTWLAPVFPPCFLLCAITRNIRAVFCNQGYIEIDDFREYFSQLASFGELRLVALQKCQPTDCIEFIQRFTGIVFASPFFGFLNLKLGVWLFWVSN